MDKCIYCGENICDPMSAISGKPGRSLPNGMKAHLECNVDTRRVKELEIKLYQAQYLLWHAKDRLWTSSPDGVKVLEVQRLLDDVQQPPYRHEYEKDYPHG